MVETVKVLLTCCHSSTSREDAEKVNYRDKNTFLLDISEILVKSRIIKYKKSFR